MSMTYQQIVEDLADGFFSLLFRHRIAILGSIVFNLIVFIVLISLELSSRSYLYDTIVLVDFDREHELFPEAKEEEKNEAEPVLPRDAIVPEVEYEAIKNLAKDATKEDLNPGLTDEKNIDADKLYQEAQRIREQMQQNRALWEEAQSVNVDDVPNTQEKISSTDDPGQYKGPTVISYFLEGRKALYLPVPAYKCELGGVVVVDIEVSSDGRVERATIDTSNSVADNCMTSAAIDAARRSRFTVTDGAKGRQKGSITYLFVPQ